MKVRVVWLRDHGRLVRYELEDPEQDDLEHHDEGQEDQDEEEQEEEQDQDEEALCAVRCAL